MKNGAVIVHRHIALSLPYNGFCNVFLCFASAGNDKVARMRVSQRVGELLADMGAGGLGGEIIVGVDLGVVDGRDALLAIICLGESLAAFERPEKAELQPSALSLSKESSLSR